MKKNPFTSNIFNTVWLKHFNNSNPSFKFDFIENVEFVKKPYLPLYINVGKNLTKGIYYKLSQKQSDFKGKIFLIYDVPSYFNIDENTSSTSNDLGLKKVFQYHGYLMDLSNFNNRDEYIKNQFSKNNKRYIRWSHIKRLENCFDITTEFIFGEISDEKYEFVFNHFYRLLNTRFEGKNVDYHHLKDSKWRFYKDLILPLIKSKQASFLVIYNEGAPIGINLNYHSESILFKAITVFDVNFFKFSIGKLSVLNLLDWCFENDYIYSDFSKGYFDYKEVWSNTQYNFNYHLLYDRKSIKAIFIANVIEVVFKFKLYLRKNNFNHLYRKLVFKIKGSKKGNDTIDKFEINELKAFTISDEFRQINMKEKKYTFLLKHVYSFLFSNPEHISKILVFEDLNTNRFVIKGATKTILIEFL